MKGTKINSAFIKGSDDMRLFTDDLLAAIREQFDYVESDPVDGDRIFLDSASGSLRLKAATNALAEHLAGPIRLVDWAVVPIL